MTAFFRDEKSKLLLQVYCQTHPGHEPINSPKLVFVVFIAAHDIKHCAAAQVGPLQHLLPLVSEYTRLT